LIISGIILSKHIFTFLGIETGLGFARVAHLLASHWYFLFMSFHIDMHVAMIAGKMKVPREGISSVLMRIIFILISLYGIYAFIIRGIWRYLILQQQFIVRALCTQFTVILTALITVILMLPTTEPFPSILWRDFCSLNLHKKMI